MPKVKLPTNPTGWAVTLASSIVGFIAGTASLAWFSKLASKRRG